MYAAEVPKGSTYQLIAAWLLLAEGGVGLVFLPIIVLSTKTNIDPAEIAAFAIGCALSLGAGALLYSKWAWSWWLALAVSVAVPAWLFATGGLTSEKEGYIAAGFGAATVLMLLLGRRAAGRPNAMALASANIPFRVKVGIVWLAIGILLATLAPEIVRCIAGRCHEVWPAVSLCSIGNDDSIVGWVVLMSRR